MRSGQHQEAARPRAAVRSTVIFAVLHDPGMRMAQYGIAHDHAHDKARVLSQTEEVEFVGVYEPDKQKIERLGGQAEYQGVLRLNLLPLLYSSRVVIL